MTAPARGNKPATRKTGRGKSTENTRARSRGRARSSAVERAYARRQGRTERAADERRARQPQRSNARESQPSRQPESKKGTTSRGASAKRGESSKESAAQQPSTKEDSAQRQSSALHKARQLPKKITQSNVPFVVTVMAVLTVGIAGTLWLSSSAVSNSYQLRQAQNRVNVLSERKEDLLRQVSVMNSAPALRKRAEELGLVMPEEAAHVVMHPDGSVSVVGDPQPAKAPPAPPPPAWTTVSSASTRTTGTLA